MSRKFEYKTLLIKGNQNAVYAEFPFDSVKEFGTRRAVRVIVTFDGANYSMSLLPNGKGGHWLHVKKEIRKTIGKEEGDTVFITLEKDNSPKIVELPEYLQWLLDNDKQLKACFNKMPYSAQKFWVGFISEPKNNDSKVTRVNQLFDYLLKNYSGKV